MPGPFNVYCHGLLPNTAPILRKTINFSKRWERNIISACSCERMYKLAIAPRNMVCTQAPLRLNLISKAKEFVYRLCKIYIDQYISIKSIFLLWLMYHNRKTLNLLIQLWESNIKFRSFLYINISQFISYQQQYYWNFHNKTVQDME